VNAESGDEDESIAKLVGSAAVEVSAGCMAWLLPVAILGGAGLLMFNAGSTETEDVFGNSNIDVNSTGAVGASLMCFAAAVFFGRGLIPTFKRVVRGEGTFSDIIFGHTNVVSALIAAGAIVAGIACLFWAVSAS